MSHITVTPSDKKVEVSFSGEVIASSTNALELKEGDYPAVYYLPLDDVNETYLSQTDHQTHCPWKGDAAYWSVEVHGERAENAVWAYPEPKEAVEDIEGYMAFYPGKLEVKVDGEVLG